MMTTRAGKLGFNQNDILGHGSSGTTIYSGFYLRSESSSFKVAIKRVLKSTLQDPSVIQREAKLMKKASHHPNILRIIRTEMDYDFLYIATELCSGSLKDYVKKTYLGPKFENKKEILRQVTRGLSYLHTKKIVHRDIKPSNILVFVSKRKTKPVIKLADFGISKMLKEDNEDLTNTSLTNPNGTKGWMPPELYEFIRVDYSVDVWALGCIFAYIFSGGKHPFGDDPDGRQNSIKKKEPIKLTQEDLQEPYSKGIFAFELIKSMLETDPSKRPTVAGVESIFFTSLGRRLSKLCESFKDCSIGLNTTDSNPPVSIGLLEKLLRDEQVDVNAKTENGNTLLHILCGWYDKDDLIDFVRLLIENGADVDAKTKDGDTPLYLLRLHYKNDNLKDIVNLLTRKDKNELNRPKESGRDMINTTQREERGIVDVASVSSPVMPDISDNIDQHPSVTNVSRKLVNEYKERSDIVPHSGRENERKNDASTDNWQQDSYDPTRTIENEKVKKDYNITEKQQLQDDVSDQLEENEEQSNEDLQSNNYVRKMDISRNLTLSKRLFKNAMIAVIIGLLFIPSQHIIKPEINHVRTNELLELSSTTTRMSYEEVENFYELVQDISVNVNTTDPLNGMNALLKLSRYYEHDNLIELVQPLIKRGINVNATSLNGTNALHNLCRYYVHENLVDLIRLLEKSSIHLQVKTKEGYTALHLLASENPANFSSKKIVIEILSKTGRRWEVSSIITNELLKLSSSTSRLLENEITIFRELVEDKNIHINTRDIFKDGRNALLKLSRNYGHDNLIELVQILIKGGIDVNATDLQYGWNALHNLCRYYKHDNLIDLIRLLHKSDIEFKVKTKKESAIFYLEAFEDNPAMRHNVNEIVKILLKEESLFEAIVKIQTKELLNLSSSKAIMMEKEITRFRDLVENGSVNINATNYNKMNALLLLSRNYEHDNLIQLVRPLIKRGIDVNATVPGGWNALHNLCRYYKHNNLIDLIVLLHQSNIEFKVKTKEGSIPFYLAAFENNPGMQLKADEIFKILPKEEDFLELIVKIKTKELLVLASFGWAFSDKEMRRFIELAKDDSVDINARDPKDGMNALLKLSQNYGYGNLIDMVRTLTEAGIDVNATNLNGWNALHNLCEYYSHKNFYDLILLLKESKINMEAKTKEGYSALFLLENSTNMPWKYRALIEILSIDKNILEFSEIRKNELLNIYSSSILRLSEKEVTIFHDLVKDDSVNINVTDRKDEMNVLLKLSRNYGHSNIMELVRPLLEKGIDVNATDPDGWNALHNLCRYYQHNNLIDLIRLLHKSNIDFEVKTEEGSIQFYLEAFANNPAMQQIVDEIGKILSKKGSLFEVIVKVQTKELLFLSSSTAMMEKEYYSTRLRELVENGSVNINATDRKDEMNVLLKLSRNYRRHNLIELVRPLIKRGINVNATDLDGWNALHNVCCYYVHNNLADLIRFLEESGIDMKAKTKNGFSALYLAVFQNSAKYNTKQVAIEILSRREDLQEVAKIRSKELLELSSYTSRLSDQEVAIFIKLLKDDNTDVNSWDKNDGMNALLKLTRSYGHENLIELVLPLVEKGIYVNTTDPDGWNALHNLCAYYKHDNLLIDLIQILRESNIDMEARTSEGYSALYLRVYVNPDILTSGEIPKILNKGKDFFEFEKNRTREFYELLVSPSKLKGKNVSRFAELVNDRSTVDVNHILTRWTRIWTDDYANATERNNLKFVPDGSALHYLCRFYNHDNLIDMAKPIIEKGIDINAQDSEGWNALHFLCRHYNFENLIELVQFFIDKGVDVNARTKTGWNLLHILYRYHSHDLMNLTKLLAEKGIDFNAQTKTGWSPLHVLFRYYRANNGWIGDLLFNHGDIQPDSLMALTELLIEKKVNLNARNLRGWTPLHHLCRYYNHGDLLNVVLVLKEKGANLTVETEEGYSASYLMKTAYRYSPKDRDKIIEILPEDKHAPIIGYFHWFKAMWTESSIDDSM